MSMPANTTDMPKRPSHAERPFPWRCRKCRQEQVFLDTISYTATVRHDGREYAIKVPRLTLPVCRNCGEKRFTEDVDDQINAALRTDLQLLTPQQIRAALERIQLTQKAAAEQLGIAEATLSRWLNGCQIQSRALDNLLRIFFAFPQVRAVLGSPEHDPLLGTTDVALPAQGSAPIHA